jgi:hypothetical protein
MKKHQPLFINIFFIRLGFYLLTAVIIFLSISFLESSFIKLFLSFLLFFILPGFSIFNIVFRRGNHFELPEKLICYFLGSLITAILPVLVAYFFNLQILTLIIILITVYCILATIDLFLSYFYYQDRAVNLSEIFSKDNLLNFSWMRWRIWLILILGLAFMFLSRKLGSCLISDAMTHIAIIRKMMSNGVSSVNPFFKDIQEFPFYAYSLWQPLIAALSKFSSLDLIYVWFRIIIFLSPLVLFAGYFFSKNLFRNRNLAFACVLVIFFFFFFINTIQRGETSASLTEITGLAFPSKIALFILMPLFFGWFFNYFYANNKKALIFIIGTAAVIVLIHLFYYALVCLGLFSFLIFYWLLNRKIAIKKTRIKSIGLVLILIVSVSALYLLLRLKTGLITPDLLSAHRQIVIDRGQVLSLKDNFFILKPKFLLSYPQSFYPTVPLLDLMIAFLIFLWFRKKDWSIFLLALMLMPFLIYFNPLAIYFLDKIIGLPKVVRICQITPVFYIFGFVIGWIAMLLKNKLRRFNFYQILGIILLILVSLGFNFFKNFTASAERISIFNNRSFVNVSPSLKIVVFLKSINKNSVIVTSPTRHGLWQGQTARMIAMVSPNYILSLGQSSDELLFGENPKIDARFQDQKKIFDPGVSMSKTISLLKKYQVNYLVVEKDKSQKFLRQARFKSVFQDGGLIFYQFGK